MTGIVGTMFAAGILLALSPWLWPAGGNGRRGGTGGRLRQVLDAAGLAHVPTGRLVCACGAGGLLLASGAWVVTSLGTVTVVAGCFGMAAPIICLRGRVRALRRQRRALWPDVCELLIASVRAGVSLPEAVAALDRTGPEPLRPVFTRFSSDLAASGHFDSAVLRAKASFADPVGDRILETLRMARQVGGTELTAVLRALAASVRADAALRGEVEARQSWIRGAAAIGVAAPWLVLVLLATRPEGVRAYATPEGGVLVIVGAVVSVVAYRLMLRFGRLPEPRRWFG